MEFLGVLDEFGPVVGDEHVSYTESDTHLSAGEAASIISSSQSLCNSQRYRLFQPNVKSSYIVSEEPLPL